MTNILVCKSHRYTLKICQTLLKTAEFCFCQIESKTLNPKWMEQFDLRMYKDQSTMLDISVWDKDLGSRDDIMGRQEQDNGGDDDDDDDGDDDDNDDDDDDNGDDEDEWMEQFDLRMYKDQSTMLDISVWDKDLGSGDDIMGRQEDGDGGGRGGDDDDDEDDEDDDGDEDEWMEQFDLRMYKDQSTMLDISVWDEDLGSRDDIMGRQEQDEFGGDDDENGGDGGGGGIMWL